ncbi:MAG: S8 family serine peptidase [Verrucomicrobiota bacterium]
MVRAGRRISRAPNGPVCRCPVLLAAAPGGSGSTSDAVDAVNYATLMRNRGVAIHLTHNSWGGGGFSQALKDAIDANGTAGMLFVAAAGNSSQDLDASNDYPAGYDSANILSVAAIDRNGAIASFSNYGLTRVDVGAPGVAILSTVPGSDYSSFNGTSMACPHAAGVAMLAWAANPNATQQEVKAAIMAGTDATASLDGKTVTGGRVNAFNTLRELGMSVIGSDPASQQLLTTLPTVFTIDFSDDYTPATVDAADLTVNGIAADSVVQTDADTLTFTFNATPVSTQGPQTMTMAAGALTRTLDSEGLKAWSATFLYDAHTMTVASTTPPQNTVVFLPFSTLRVDFSEPFDATTLDNADLLLSEGAVTGFTQIDADTVEYALSGVSTDALWIAQIPGGQINDAFGNPIATQTLSYLVDYGVVPFPGLPLERIPFFGGLTYQGIVNGHLASADLDEFTIQLEAGQAATIAVIPSGAGLTPSVTLRNSLDSVLATQTAAAAGEIAKISNHAVAATDTYKISLNGAGSGDYELRLILNSGLETESNDTAGTANNIDSAFITLDGGVSRGGARGEIDTSAGDGEDWFSFTAAQGDRFSVSLGKSAGDPVSLELYDPAQNLMTVGVFGGGHDQLIEDVVAGSSGAFFVRVFGAGASDYNVVVVREATPDIEPNSNLGVAQPIRLASNAIGFIGAGAPAITEESEPNDDGSFGSSETDRALANDISTSWTNTGGDTYEVVLTGGISQGGDGDWDFFKFFAAPGDSISIAMVGLGLPDTYLRLYDSSGNQIAFNDDGGVGFNSLLDFNSFAAAEDYYVVADSYGSNTGTYRLTITFTTTNLTTSSPIDIYSFEAAAGDNLSISTTTPFVGAGEIVNLLDPAIELYNPSDTLVASDANGAPDGRNATLSFTTAAAGVHKILVKPEAGTIGEYLLNLSGATQTSPGLDVATIDPTNGSSALSAPTEITINFGRAINRASVQASDLTVNGVTATGLTFVDNQTVRFAIGDPGGGTHNVAIAAGAIEDLQGNGLAAFSSTFTVDNVAPEITAMNIAENEVLAPGDITVIVDFSEPMYQPSIIPSNFPMLALNQGGEIAPTSYNYSGQRLSATYSIPDDDILTFTIVSGASEFRDVAGNALAPGSVTRKFSTDAVSLAGGADFAEKTYLPGSLVYEEVLEGAIGVDSDVDEWTVNLKGGQILAAILDLDAALQASLEVIAPDSTSYGTETAAAAGETIKYSSTIDTGAGGEFTIRVAGAAGTERGVYDLKLIVGAALEMEALGSDTNNIAEKAEAIIDQTFITLDGASQRGAICGFAHAANSSDQFSFSGTAGETVTLVASSSETVSSLILWLPSGGLAAGSTAVSGGNADRALRNHVLTQTGEYKVSTALDSAGEYTLLVLKNADFDIENNPGNEGGIAQGNYSGRLILGHVSSGESVPAISAESEPNDAAGSGGGADDLPFADDLRGSFTPTGTPNQYSASVTGTISSGNDNDFDFFRIVASPGDTLVIDHIGNGLSDPYLRLYDSSGAELETDDDGGSGLDSQITRTTFAYAGDYFVAAESYGSETGTYTLTVTHTTNSPFGAEDRDAYLVNLPEDSEITFTTITPNDQPGAPQNTLDPLGQVENSVDRSIVRPDADGPDGKNARITFTTGPAVTRQFVVAADADTKGSYLLKIETNALIEYEEWRVAEFAGHPDGVEGPHTEPDADPDSDGLTNIEEFAYGLNPLASDAGSPRLARSISFSGRLGLEFDLPRQIASDLMMFVDASSDLENWTNIKQRIGGQDWAGQGEIEITDLPDAIRIRILDTQLQSTENQRFLRMRFALSNP